MSSLRDNWTRDAQGNYVDWSKPPYRQPGSGILSLLLAGEKADLLEPEIRVQRIQEFYALLRRNRKR